MAEIYIYLGGISQFLETPVIYAPDHHIFAYEVQIENAN